MNRRAFIKSILAVMAVPAVASAMGKDFDYGRGNADHLINYGTNIRRGSLTTIIGDTASGKTTLMLYHALVLSHAGYKVLYQNCENHIIPSLYERLSNRYKLDGSNITFFNSNVINTAIEYPKSKIDAIFYDDFTSTMNVSLLYRENPIHSHRPLRLVKELAIKNNQQCFVSMQIRSINTKIPTMYIGGSPYLMHVSDEVMVVTRDIVHMTKNRKGGTYSTVLP